MIYAPLSNRQKIAMLWWMVPEYQDLDAIICDGSIRSGKTVSMTDGFVFWSMEKFNKEHFAMCGKTVESFRRNVVLHLRDWIPSSYDITEKRSENLIIIRYGEKENYFHIFGGRDESSYMLIQGMTLAGIFLDEVALMPRSFVEQAVSRCSVNGSKYWFNCNPGSPEHWFYKEWVKQSKKKKSLRIHFTMDDNFGLHPDIKKRYEETFTGVFYSRYILGLWCVADGLIYGFFNRKDHVVKFNIEKIRKPVRWFISCDYGTHNPFSSGLWCLGADGIAIRSREYYYDGRKEHYEKTPEEYYVELEKLAGDLPIEYVIVDPAASEFITTVRRHGKFSVRKAKNSVLDGIRMTGTALKAGFIKIGDTCRDCIREFGLYSWDDSSKEDRVKKENDHSMDDVRYFVYTALRRESSQFRAYLKGLGQDEEDD